MRAQQLVSKRTAIVLLLIASAVAAGWTVRHHYRYQHFAVHVPDRIYRSAWLEADVMAELVRTYHLRTVVNLCAPGEMGDERREQERAAITAAGARFIEISMPLTLDLESPEVLASLGVLDDSASFPLLVHCQHGVTRTAKFLTLYDIQHRGMTAKQSLGRMPLFSRKQHGKLVWEFAELFEKHVQADAVSNATVRAAL